MKAALSVVLCTYNGATFLPDLLASLARQSKVPDELLVFDDGSTDATTELIDAFARHAPFAIHRHQQAKRLGPAANFMDAARHARGDWIAFCDQDDVWHPHKLAAMHAASERQPDASAIFCDAHLVNTQGQTLGRTLWEHVRYTPVEQQQVAAGHAWEVLVKHPVVCGAGLMIHARVRDHLSPIADAWMHDAWAALIAAALGPLVGIPAPLFDYRQHGNNLIGAARTSLRQQWATFLAFDRQDYLDMEYTRWQVLATRLASLPSSPRQSATRQAVADKLAHLAFRQTLPSLRRQRYAPLWRAVRAGHYQRFTKGWRPWLADLLLR